MKKRHVVDTLEAKITKFGTGAHAVLPIQYVGKEAFVHVLNKKKTKGSEEKWVVTDGETTRLVSDPRHKLVSKKALKEMEGVDELKYDPFYN